MAIRWDLLLYALMIGFGMATFLCVAAKEARGLTNGNLPVAAVALIATAAGLVLKCLQYGRPERIFRVLGNPSSIIAIELILASLCIVLMLVYIVMTLRNSSDGVRKLTAIVGGLVALFGIISTGMVYYLPARPAWDTLFLPSIYLFSSISVGLPFVMLFSSGEGGGRRYYMLSLAVGVLFLISIIGYVFAVSCASFPHESRSVARLLAGNLSLYFYVGVLGVLVPVIIALSACVKKCSEVAAYILIICLISNAIGAIFIRASAYAMGTSIQLYIY